MRKVQETHKKTTMRITPLLLGVLLCMQTACAGQTAQEKTAEQTTEVQSETFDAQDAEVQTEAEAPDVQAAETESETPDTQNAEAESATQAALPTTDPSGTAIVIPEQVESIVALAPSINETLVALGLEEKIAGYDLQSVGLAGMPEGVPTFDTVNPDVEQLTALAPDMLLVSSLSLYDQEAPYQPLIDAGVCVVCVPTSVSIENVRSDIRFLAAALSVPEEGERVVKEMDAELNRISAIVADVPDEVRKNVYFEISPAPYLYSCGSDTYLHEMIELAGGKNVFVDQSGWLSVEGETVVAANPDVIFTNVNYTDAPVDEILGREGWAGVNAVTTKDVYYIDNMASSLPNQNIVKAVEQMAKALYPKRFGVE